MLKQIIILILILGTVSASKAQTAGSFMVRGDINKYYPVVFYDGGWEQNTPTELSIGRSYVHVDGSWRGSIMSKFRYHVNNWGNGADFIDADLAQHAYATVAIDNFVGGWVDITPGNNNYQIVIWLRGGTTTYNYTANYAVNPQVFDGVQNPLPLQVLNFPALTYKTSPDSYVTTNGFSTSRNVRVAGIISANKVKVTQNGWADYVFDSAYVLKPLHELDHFIQTNKHLPEIPSAKDIETNGLDLGEIVKQQQVKIEELTLYIIEQDKAKSAQQTQLNEQAALLKQLQQQIQQLQKNNHH
jgi:hypothetical protein